MFNFFNYYFPFFIIAFYQKSFEDVFSLTMFQMVFKQIGLNLMEYYTPDFFTRKQLSALNENF